MEYCARNDVTDVSYLLVLAFNFQEGTTDNRKEDIMGRFRPKLENYRFTLNLAPTEGRVSVTWRPLASTVKDTLVYATNSPMSGDLLFTYMKMKIPKIRGEVKIEAKIEGKEAAIAWRIAMMLNDPVLLEMDVPVEIKKE